MSRKNTTDSEPPFMLDDRISNNLCETAKNKTSNEFCSRQPRATQKRTRPGRANAARERCRVKTLRAAFLDVQRTLPSVPQDTKLAKLDILVLATTYIAQLTRTLDEMSASNGDAVIFVPANAADRMTASCSTKGYLHPVKKWPMRMRLYAGMVANANCNSTDCSV